MAYQRIGMAITLVLVTVLWTGATAQTDCTNVLISLSPCLNYITGNSSTPSSGCCTQLASVVLSKPVCLCQVLSSGGSSLGIQVNQTQAEALPGTCNVQTPPLSSCNSKNNTIENTCQPTEYSKSLYKTRQQYAQISLHSKF